MICNVVMVVLREDHDREEVAAIQAGLRALDPPGCRRYRLGNDLGLRDGNWSFAIVAEFEDEASYRAYDLDPEHNRLRARLGAQVSEIARVQFELDA
jgi:quinol monooxygenase YgiN